MLLGFSETKTFGNNTTLLIKYGVLPSLFFFCGGQNQYEEYLKRHSKMPRLLSFF